MEKAKAGEREGGRGKKQQGKQKSCEHTAVASRLRVLGLFPGLS